MTLPWQVGVPLLPLMDQKHHKLRLTLGDSNRPNLGTDVKPEPGSAGNVKPEPGQMPRRGVLEIIVSCAER
jgi:hypothetical protein